MADQTKTERAREISESLVPLRSRLDQLSKQVQVEESEGQLIQRSTTEALMGVLGSLNTLEEAAREIDHKRVLGEVLKERARARQALGFEPRRRRR